MLVACPPAEICKPVIRSLGERKPKVLGCIQLEWSFCQADLGGIREGKNPMCFSSVLSEFS